MAQLLSTINNSSSDTGGQLTVNNLSIINHVGNNGGGR